MGTCILHTNKAPGTKITASAVQGGEWRYKRKVMTKTLILTLTKETISQSSERCFQESIAAVSKQGKRNKTKKKKNKENKLHNNYRTGFIPPTP